MSMISGADFYHWVVVSVLACAACLWGEWRRWTTTTLIAKMIAATAYLLAALSLGAMETAYGRILLGAMACCWIGDLMLVSRSSRRLFVIGLAAFLAGHVVYAVAFWQRGQSLDMLCMAVPAMVVFAFLVTRWLWPYLDKNLRLPVIAYVLAISVMMALAVGAWGASGGWSIAVGALAFVVSDIGVARNRFVAPGMVNRSWGLPTYFAAQLLLAWSVTT